MSLNKQNGFTLMELMIGLIVGLVATSAAIAGFITVSQNSREVMKMVALNGSVRDAATYISREIRRIGYWDLAKYAAYPSDELTLSAITGTNVIVTGTNNIFSNFESNGGIANMELVAANGNATVTNYTSANNITVDINTDFDTDTLVEGTWRFVNPFDASTNPSITDNGTTDCILYQYDNNGDTVIDSAEQHGIRLNSNTIEQWTSGTYSCTNGTWTALSDPLVVLFTEFDLTLNEASVDIDASGSGSSVMVIRTLTITLTGQDPSDNSITRTVNRSIKVRNNRFLP